MIRQNVCNITDTNPELKTLLAKQLGVKVKFSANSMSAIQLQQSGVQQHLLKQLQPGEQVITLQRLSPARPTHQEDPEQASSHPVPHPTPTVETSSVIQNSDQSSVIQHTAAIYSSVSPATESNLTDKQEWYQRIRKELESKPTLAGVSVDVSKQILSKNPKTHQLTIF